LWSKPTKPRVQILVVSRHPASAHVHDSVLLFLPPCGPHLIPFGHRVHRAKPTCLSTPRRPCKARPFAPTLHLHQCKSSCNLHLQYSAKSQSKPRQSLITKDRPSTGPRTLRSLISPLMGALTTHIVPIRERKKHKRKEQKSQTNDQKPNKSQR
jgi:hypothetical protein